MSPLSPVLEVVLGHHSTHGRVEIRQRALLQVMEGRHGLRERLSTVLGESLVHRCPPLAKTLCTADAGSVAVAGAQGVVRGHG